jgi:branched-chain amino acid transport system ATP-binding protein
MLRLDGIKAGYDGVEVLRGVDLIVPSGATVALVGANGAGKTTLLRVAAGLLPIRSGRVDLDGRDLSDEPPHRRVGRGLCFVPEGGGIFRPLTVGENIAMYAQGRDTATATAAVLQTFPALERFLDVEAGRLSGGQQQMLALSRALVTAATTVLADELSMGLAPVVVDEIFEVIRRLRSEGRSLLLVEQYVDRVLDIADYVYLLHKGEVVLVGEPEQCRHSEVFDRYLGVLHEVVAG